MEKAGISSLDLRFLVKEFRKFLTNGFIRKIYQYEGKVEGKKSHQFLFEVYVPQEGRHWLYVDRNKIFLTTYKKPSPMSPPNFCLFLRKHMNNSKITDIRQHEFDRIVEIRTDKNVLVIELFSDGNLILCDRERNIIMPLYVQRWKDRDVKPKMEYKYPPPKINPFAVNLDYFREFLSKFDRKLIAVLAAGFGLGANYAREVCKRANVKEDMQADRLSLETTRRIFDTIQGIDNLSVRPVIYDGFVSPFPLQSAEGQETKKQASTVSEAFDEFFSGQEIETAEREEEEVVKEHEEKFGNILEKQQEAFSKWGEEKEERTEKANIIYSHYGTVESIIDALNKARSSGLTWEEIKSRVNSESTPEADAIKEIKEHEGKVVVELGEEEVEIDFTKSVEQNAEEYYEGSKHAKKKMAGAHQAMQETQKKLDTPPEVAEVPKPVKVKSKERKWYDKFRWFRSSDGFLVVGGKDADTNEEIIKKHTDAGDLVFHSDIQGSPFVVIKAGDKGIEDYAKKEAAEFTAAYSKAWSSGLATVDVYAIGPDQVSKQPPTGEHLPKGSFMIYGQREWFRDVELKVAIGVKMDREEETVEVIAGPVMSLRKHSDYFITVRPGSTEATELAREIKNKILIKASPEDKTWIEKLPLDQFQRYVPGGKGEVVEYGV